MAKSTTRQNTERVDRAFKKAWKLLGQLERRLALARADEAKRTKQLGDGSGRSAARRSTQLDAARAEIAQVEALLTELSALISSNAGGSSAASTDGGATKPAPAVPASGDTDAPEADLPDDMAQTGTDDATTGAPKTRSTRTPRATAATPHRRAAGTSRPATGTPRSARRTGTRTTTPRRRPRGSEPNSPG